jgi:TPR repeat protein
MKAYRRKDYEAALRIWKPLAWAGDGRAAFRVAEMFEFAEGIPKDEKKAAEYYLIAAEANHPVAQLRMAGRYEYGRGVARSSEESLKWFMILRDNPQASMRERKEAKAQVDVFYTVYVLENVPDAKEIMRRAEAKARAWANKQKQ